jgi:xanthine dehydrogenase accessory factor
MKSLATWQLISDSLQKAVPVMLLYVLESNGSSPGRQGFFMAVAYDGPSAPLRMEGSLGGGIMEHKFVEMVKAKLLQHEEEVSVHKQIHDKSAPKNQSGMICSGEQTILLYKIPHSDEDHINKIINCLQEHRNGTLQLTPAGISFIEKLPEQDYSFRKESEEDWTYIEKVGCKNNLYIIGAGHCALALSKIMRMMDFYIHLYDDRKNLNTMLKNEYVHEKHEVKDYTELSEHIPEGDSNYVVIMTFGYRTDYIALWSLMNKKFKYTGLLGSKNKIEKMFADYVHEGVEQNVLEAVHAPVGLNIKSQTPEEIAISIAAEIIKVKNQA